MAVEDDENALKIVKQGIKPYCKDFFEASDGVVGLEIFKKNTSLIDIIITDIHMPRMNGFEFTKIVKNDPKLSHLKVIALTSLAGEDDMAKGRSVGIDDYQIKLDRDNLMISIRQHIL